MGLRKEIEKNLLEYVKAKTYTGTSLETNNMEFFTGWFNKVEYFKKNPERWGFYDMKGDHLNRKISWGLMKGQGKDTVVLLHHSDTVNVEDYGILQDFAHDPYEISKKFKEGKVDFDDDTRKDLESGNWLFGRGVADMKGGGSIQLSLLEEYSKDKDFKGNILLVAVPDEENISAGMRGAVPLLKELKEEHDLNYLVMLNSEPHEREEDDVITLYDGSVGKLLPMVYVRGKLTHVGQIYEGLNPINLLAEIVRKTEVNPDFIEVEGNTASYPPSWSNARDKKEVYDASIPIAAAGYMNLLPLDRPPREVFQALYGICQEAFEEVIAGMEASYKRYGEIVGKDLEGLPWESNVKYYGDVYDEALRNSGKDFTKAYDDLMGDIKKKVQEGRISMVNAGSEIIEKTLEYIKDPTPMVVLALIPPYYPSVCNRMIPEKCHKINEALEHAKTYSKEKWGQDCYIKNYFMGISDLSYAMFKSDKENIEYIENNMLMWGDIYQVPLDTMKELSIPVLNIGPWGKDLHKYTERVYIEDLFDKTPQLVDQTIKYLLG